jgi:dTDP-4-dehydrorhamnose reductase
MRILLTGARGQVGAALARTLAPLGELEAHDRASLDLLHPSSFEAAVARARPDIVVNAAAYTAVDRAEREPELAFKVNAEAAGALAQAAKSVGALLVHFSTDYVFDGEKTQPYVETDAPNPLGVYGHSKLEGERAIAASGCRHFIFRTSWVYSRAGRNFANAILAAAMSKPELRVVNDQRGAPTSAAAIAGAVASVLASSGWRNKPDGIYHLTAVGETTWFGFALEILKGVASDVRLVPVTTAEYGAAAPRPRNSLLDNAKLRETFGIALEDWRHGFRAAFGAVD